MLGEADRVRVARPAAARCRARRHRLDGEPVGLDHPLDLLGVGDVEVGQLGGHPRRTLATRPSRRGRSPRPASVAAPGGTGVHRGSPDRRRGTVRRGGNTHARPSSTITTRPPFGDPGRHHRTGGRRLGHDRRRFQRAAGGHGGRRAGRHQRHAHRQRDRRPSGRPRRRARRGHGRRPDRRRRWRDRLRPRRAGQRPGAVRHRPRCGLYAASPSRPTSSTSRASSTTA